MNSVLHLKRSGILVVVCLPHWLCQTQYFRFNLCILELDTLTVCSTRPMQYPKNFLAEKIENVVGKRLIVQNIFSQNIDCGYLLSVEPTGEAVSLNLCFGAKIRKGYKGVFVAMKCLYDVIARQL